MPYCVTGKMHWGISVLAKLYQEHDEAPGNTETFAIHCGST